MAVTTDRNAASVPVSPWHDRLPVSLHAVILAASVLAAGIAAVVGVLAIREPDMRAVLTLIAAGAAALALLMALAGLRLSAIARSAGFAAEALHNLSAHYVMASPEGIVLYANAAASSQFPPGSSLLDVLRDGIRDGGFQPLLEHLEAGGLTGRMARAVLRARWGEGKLRVFDIAVTPISGRPARALWRIEDVTEREEHREAIEADRARIVDVIDEAPIGLYSIDRDGKFLMINRTLAGWLGSTPDRLLGEDARLQDFLIPGDDSPRPAFEPYAPAEGLEIILRGRQGKMLKAAVSQTIDRNGASLRTRSVIRDLSSERTWEDVLRPLRQRFQRFFEIAPVGIALIEAEGRFQETNRALEDLLTDGREMLTGRDLFEFVADDHRAEVEQRLASIWLGEQIAAPLELRLKGVREKTVALFVSRLETEDGDTAGLTLHFIDLTEQKNLEVQFAQSQKMQAVGQLAGGVAHDFNNLLTAMIGFCDLLLLRFRPGDQSFADIMQIKQNANRAANLVRQLLAFSRQQTLQPRVIGIGDVLAELSHLLNRLLGDNIELKMIHGRNLGPVKVDQGQLEQVIINLAVNARDAMTDGGTLTIRTSSVESREPITRELETMPAGAYVLIEVTDDGTGIPREIIGRIFEPFFSTKEVGSGTGLGLSTVYGIVKQTGGFIFVELIVGSGTKFSIYLPQHTQTADEAVKAGAADPADPAELQMPNDLTGTGTVLLVEDEDPVRLFGARALRNKGYTVLEAKSGEAALKIIAETIEPIDLIITDVVMPRMDGPTLIKQVRESLPAVKVIFISGYTEDAFRKRLDDEEDIQFLAKPFSLKQLAAKVKEIIATPAN